MSMSIVIGLVIGLVSAVLKLRRFPGTPRQVSRAVPFTYSLISSIYVYFGAVLLLWVYGLVKGLPDSRDVNGAISFVMALGNLMSCGAVFLIAFWLKQYRLVKPSEDFGAQRDEVNSEIDELNASIDERNAEIEDLKEQVSDLEGQNADDQARMAELRVELSNIDSREATANGTR